MGLAGNECLVWYQEAGDRLKQIKDEVVFFYTCDQNESGKLTENKGLERKALGEGGKIQKGNLRRAQDCKYVFIQRDY